MDARATIEHAKDWGCVYKDLALRVGVSYRRFLMWMDGEAIMMPDEQCRLERLAGEHIADQKRAVDLVMANPWGIAGAIGAPRSTVKGWRNRMRVPLPWVDAVIEKGPDAPMPARLSVEERRAIATRAAGAHWGDMGPWQRVVLQRIVDAPDRAYLYALANDHVVRKAQVVAALRGLQRRGLVEVVGWKRAGAVSRKMYAATDYGHAALARAPKEKARAQGSGVQASGFSLGRNVIGSRRWCRPDGA